MDDAKNRQYARAPELEDLVALCRALHEQNVQYILIGDFAVILHGGIRGTKDIDLLIDPGPNNVQKIKKALSKLPDNAIALIQDDEVEKYAVVRVADEIVIDLMAKACGIDYEKARQGIEYKTVEGVRIPIPKKELLIQMKDTLRDSDKMDVRFLKYQIEEEKKRGC